MNQVCRRNRYEYLIYAGLSIWAIQPIDNVALIYLTSEDLLQEVVVVLESVSSLEWSHSIEEQEIAFDPHNQKQVHIVPCS